MPVLPLHFGPGLALYGITRRCDFWAFAAANAVIDLESGWNLARGNYPVHAFMHTFLGATLAIVPGIVLGYIAWRIFQRLRIGSRPSNGALVVGAAAGAWSHILLDGIMHLDCHPLRPWSDAQPWLRVIPVPVLNSACALAAVIGIVLIIWRRRSAN